MDSSTSPIEAVLRDNLARFREQQGLTQAELGRRAGMAAASVSHFETGQRTPSVESLVKLSDALSVSMDALVGRSVGMERQIDPVFLQASRADTSTLDTVKRVAAALLADAERRRK